MLYVVGISKKGKDGFYKGETAKKIVKAMKSYDGLIEQKDLEAYKADFAEPITTIYRNKKVSVEFVNRWSDPDPVFPDGQVQVLSRGSDPGQLHPDPHPKCKDNLYPICKLFLIHIERNSL